MHLNMFSPNRSHASDDTECISTCVAHPMPARTQNDSENVFAQTNPMAAKTQNASQHIYQNFPMPARTQTCVDNPIPCQREHKMHLNMC
jgi:hypothetical protein